MTILATCVRCQQRGEVGDEKALALNRCAACGGSLRLAGLGRAYTVVRGYSLFGTQLKRFAAAVGRRCSAIWGSFQSRAPERATLLVLSFSLSLLFHAMVLLTLLHPGWVLGLLAASVALILVCNSRSAEYLARAVLGALGVSAIILFVAPVLVVALAVFAVYLALLVVLTALTALAFVPMRLGHGAWLLWRGIYRRCPYDDCGRAGLPIHVCSCGARYPDLLPNFYGVFYHTCYHADGRRVWLPTMDFLGRRLPRLCRHCGRRLVLSSFGELPERPVALVGGPAAGKTIFLRQAVRVLRARLGSLPGGRAEVDADEHAAELNHDLGLLDRGLLPAKTAGDVMQALGLAVRLRRPRRSCLLYLYDAPGEDFMSLERLGRKQHLEHLAGVVLLLDPFSLPLLRGHGRRLSGSASPSTLPPEQVVGVLAAATGRLGTGPGGRCTAPLAVVLTKSDALPVEELPFLAALRIGTEGRRPASAAVREALERLGGGNAARALEQRFDNVRYFACSALGRPPDAADTRPFRPEGVAEPLLWLLGLDSAGDGVDPCGLRLKTHQGDPRCRWNN